jgi:hypothetical protein
LARGVVRIENFLVPIAPAADVNGRWEGTGFDPAVEVAV